jgi:hypothetical protein
MRVYGGLENALTWKTSRLARRACAGAFPVAHVRSAATIVPMCNTYRIQPKRGAAKDVASQVADVVEKLPSSLVRKSDPVVVIRDGMELKIQLS